MENAETIPLHFRLELEGLGDQGRLNGWKAYKACYGQGFMCQAHLKGVGLTQHLETVTLQNLTTLDLLLVTI